MIRKLVDSRISKAVYMNKENPAESTFPYWVNNIYSLGYWLKDYGYYPKDLPLFTYMDHGMTLFDKIPPHEINNDAPLIFKFSPRLVEIYKQKTKKPVYNLLNPAIHYRNSQKVEKVVDAKGSLFFVAHSTPLIDDLTEWEPFIEYLKKIPQIFHPIDICLHYSDIKKGLGDIFSKHGYHVFCAGDVYSRDFINKFYDILRRYRFSLSNMVGSYTFYSVEMGIPFSLYGNEPKLINRGDENIESGIYESYKAQQSYQKAKELFSQMSIEISKEQAYFVNYELGKYSTISRRKASLLLYKAYLSYCIKQPTHIRLIMGLLKRYLKRSIKITGCY
jgi:hypothetical protein